MSSLAWTKNPGESLAYPSYPELVERERIDYFGFE